GRKANEKIFDLDHTAGEVVLGPAVRQADGTLRGYGAVPPKGAQMRLRAYRTGGGRRGNVARNMLTVLKSSVPFVRAVTNRRPAARDRGQGHGRAAQLPGRHGGRQDQGTATLRPAAPAL